jgi:hypothetical protein
VITEPATLLTDYLLAAFTAALAWKLYASGGAARRWWAVGFAATAVAGLAGGTVHGFRLMMPPSLTGVLWIVTLEALLVAGLAIIAATCRPALPVAAVGYAAYAIWVATHPRFVFAIIGYGLAVLVLLPVHVMRWMTMRSRASLWMLAGIAVTVVAAVVQQSDWDLHRHFNHNDLYHVIQAVGVWLLYKGAREEGAREIRSPRSGVRGPRPV